MTIFFFKILLVSSSRTNQQQSEICITLGSSKVNIQFFPCLRRVEMFDFNVGSKKNSCVSFCTRDAASQDMVDRAEHCTIDVLLVRSFCFRSQFACQLTNKNKKQKKKENMLCNSFLDSAWIVHHKTNSNRVVVISIVVSRHFLLAVSNGDVLLGKVYFRLYAHCL